METYESIRQWKDLNITNHLESSDCLNKFHDQVMLKVLQVAMSKLDIDTPCKLTWFITGSGGRFEQGLISDQDHGIIYETSNEINDEYFKRLGEEVSYGLDVVGYPYCKGHIMSSNPIWCKSLKDWKSQLSQWMKDESWEAIRYLQIFYDARSLFGEENYINQLKSLFYEYQMDNPKLLNRFEANMKFVKNVIGPMGQIIVEQHGIYQGCIDLKYSAFLPYVNSIRLLSIKEGIFATSTLDRIIALQQIHSYQELLKNCKSNFSKLLKYRMSLIHGSNYEDTHYIKIKNLTKEERKELKHILKDGKRLHDEVIGHKFR